MPGTHNGSAYGRPRITKAVILNKSNDTALKMKCALPPGSAALLVAHNNAIVVDWGKTSEKFWVHSIRKSFLSALTGIAVREGRLHLETPLGEYPFLSGELNKQEANATFRDLLLSRSGVYLPAAAADRDLPPRGCHRPGEAWFYNNWGFNSVQRILEQSCNCNIFTLFSREIAKPLGLKNFNPDKDGLYVGSEEHAVKAGFFRMDSYDLLRFGQLYLDGGVVDGRKILHPDWIRESILPASQTDLGNGYGYMWWVSTNGISIPGMQSFYPDLYYAWGWGGHYLVVIPSCNMVMVHRTDTDDVSGTIHVNHEEFARITEEALNCVRSGQDNIYRAPSRQGQS